MCLTDAVVCVELWPAKRVMTAPLKRYTTTPDSLRCKEARIGRKLTAREMFRRSQSELA